MASWAWAAAALRLLSWTVAFVALAHVGGGTVQRLLAATPPPAWSTARPPAGSLAAVPPPRLAATTHRACATAGCPVRDAGADAPEQDRPPKAITADGRVILNLAGPQDLMQLDGVGVKRAQAIIELRSQLGRFRRVEDLLRVRGIGYRLLKRLRPQVVVDPPAEQP